MNSAEFSNEGLTLHIGTEVLVLNNISTRGVTHCYLSYSPT